jgi:hypothetical protein
LHAAAGSHEVQLGQEISLVPPDQAQGDHVDTRLLHDLHEELMGHGAA